MGEKQASVPVPIRPKAVHSPSPTAQRPQKLMVFPDPCRVVIGAFAKIVLDPRIFDESIVALCGPKVPEKQHWFSPFVDEPDLPQTVCACLKKTFGNP